ncbi:hypothetical protein V2J09_005548 [Rumex salicifolius]
MSSSSSSSSLPKSVRILFILLLVSLLLTPQATATRPGRSIQAVDENGAPAKVVVRLAYNFLPKGHQTPSAPSKKHNSVVDSVHG